MSLEGLLEVGEIERLACGKREIAGLLAKAARKLNDAKAENISSETRLEQAYTVILTCATIALRAMDYRVISISAQHYLTIETTRHTLGLDSEKIDYFQTIRNKRHQDIYGVGLEINDDDLDEAIKEAEELLRFTESWLIGKHPHLLK
jgi:uncharacterized protein (UPF0332 family)